MANEQNLIPNDERSPSEVRENGKKGGIASGKSRRRKKALRTALKEAVSLPLKDLPPDLRDGIMIAAKVTDEELTVAEVLIGSIVRTACNGNSQMAKLLLDTIGESMDARIREREMRFKDKSLDEERTDNVAPITFIFEREEPE